MIITNFFNKCIEKICTYNKERYLLPFSLILLALIDEECRNNAFIYIFIVFSSSYIILVNFPGLVTWYSCKPLYYDELFIDMSKFPSLKISDDKKNHYKQIYKNILTFYDSLIISLISNYWFFKTENANSYYEIIGITGGILQIFHILNQLTGTTILYVVKCMINNNHRIAITNLETNSLPLNNSDSSNLT